MSLIGLLVMMLCRFMYSHYANQDKKSIGIYWAIFGFVAAIVVLVESMLNVIEIIG